MTVALVVGRLTEGAPQRQLVALARHLDARRHVVRVYCLSDLADPYGPELSADGHPVITVPGRGPRDRRRILTLARALRADGIDVVHAFGWGAGVYGLLAARLARVVTVVLSVPPSSAVGGGATGYLRTDAVRRATVVLAESYAEATRLHESIGVSPARLRVVYDGVALSRLTARARFDGLRDLVRGGPPVVVVAAPWRCDGARRLVEKAAGRVLEHRADARFVCCAPREHAALVEETSVGGRAGTAIVTDAAIRTHELGRATVLWAIGADRPVLGCMLEGMAAGRAVIATRHADSEQILADGAGVLVAADDDQALAERTVELAQNGSRRRELGGRARERSQARFSVAEMTRAVAAVYQQALLGLVDGGLVDGGLPDADAAAPAIFAERAVLKDH